MLPARQNCQKCEDEAQTSLNNGLQQALIFFQVGEETSWKDTNQKSCVHFQQKTSDTEIEETIFLRDTEFIQMHIKHLFWFSYDSKGYLNFYLSPTFISSCKKFSACVEAEAPAQQKDGQKNTQVKEALLQGHPSTKSNRPLPSKN